VNGFRLARAVLGFLIVLRTGPWIAVLPLFKVLVAADLFTDMLSVRSYAQLLYYIVLGGLIYSAIKAHSKMVPHPSSTLHFVACCTNLLVLGLTKNPNYTASRYSGHPI